MGLINKTRVTDNLAVIIGKQHIDVIATEHFSFEVQIKFVKVDDVLLDDGADKKVFTPEYQLAFAAAYKEKSTFFKNIEEIKNFTKQLKEIQKLFEFAIMNKQTWFDTAMFDGVLTQRVGAL
ncbi:hypothetical protein [Streptococcus merionis]|uniref:hypothetical protein n=1 Tax=Streptococcus merionis TaxID=400065 RepID=UPI003517B3CC